VNILITGSTSGIGEKLAIFFLEQGHHVVCCGRNKKILLDIKQRYPKQANTLCFDIADYQTTLKKISTVDKLDMAILNAGICEYIDIPQFDAQAFQRVINTNVIGVANCIEALIPRMKRGSRLALLGSSASYVPLPRAEAYGASKAAIEYLAKTLAMTLKPLAIKVSYIAPGFVKTPLTDQNDFPMPIRIDAADAASRIIDGLAWGKSEIHFPRRFTGVLKMIRALPTSCQQWLISGLFSHSKQ
jgi:NAD(P)-dependent dehydrogenase (short-subunit alcohol dehydrogenase family)